MAALCNRAGHIYFQSMVSFIFLSSFFSSLISAVGDWMSTILPHMVWHLECRSETCCARLGANTARKKSPKSCHLGTIPQLCRAISSQIRHVSTIGKKLVNSNISSTCPRNICALGQSCYGLSAGWLIPTHPEGKIMSPYYGELSPLATEIILLVWGTCANFNGFLVLAALLHGTLIVGVSKTCGVEQRAPPIFSRAAITLGIGPHF